VADRVAQMVVKQIMERTQGWLGLFEQPVECG
jgi:hypothetical protein